MQRKVNVPPVVLSYFPPWASLCTHRMETLCGRLQKTSFRFELRLAQQISHERSMFVLPRPPANRDGRQRLSFNSRPVSAVDVASVEQRETLDIVSRARVVHDDGLNWFPSHDQNRTYHDEFSQRSKVINECLEERTSIAARFHQHRYTLIARGFHQLVFDEQWEREAITDDAKMFLWGLLTVSAQQIMIDDVVSEEVVGRAALEQLALACFLTTVATGEFLARRRIVAECSHQSALLKEVEQVERDRQDLCSTWSSSYAALVQFEGVCRIYLRSTMSISTARKELALDESKDRKHLKALFWTTRSMIVESFSLSGMELLWKHEGKLSLNDMTVTEFLAGEARIIQALVRGWLVRRRRVS